MQEIDSLQNPLILRVLRSHEGQDVIMRVIAVGEKLWTRVLLATAPQVLISANHPLPIIREVWRLPVCRL